jgi:hypothetical protein
LTEADSTITRSGAPGHPSISFWSGTHGPQSYAPSRCPGEPSAAFDERPLWRAWVEQRERVRVPESAETFRRMVRAGRAMLRTLDTGHRRDYVVAHEPFQRAARTANDRPAITNDALATAISLEASGCPRRLCWRDTAGGFPSAGCRALGCGPPACPLPPSRALSAGGEKVRSTGNACRTVS